MIVEIRPVARPPKRPYQYAASSVGARNSGPGSPSNAARTANPAAMSSAMTAGRASREGAIVSPSSTGELRGHPLGARPSRQGDERYACLGNLAIGPVGAGILALHAPLVGELVDQEEAPARARLRGLFAERLVRRLEARTLVDHADPHVVVLDVDVQEDRLLRPDARVLDGVRDELRHEQPDVEQDVRIQPV